MTCPRSHPKLVMEADLNLGLSQACVLTCHMLTRDLPAVTYSKSTAPMLLEAQSPLWVRASVPRVENSDHNRSSPETSRAQISGKGLIGPARSHVHSLTNQLCPGLHVYLVAKLCLTLCNRMGPGSSVHGILQARILEWVAMLSSRESPLRDLRSVSCTGRWILYH